MMQTPVFLILFLAPVYVPLDLLSGWIHAVASVNPATALLKAGRGLISGEPGDVALGFACAVGWRSPSPCGRCAACAAPSAPASTQSTASASRSSAGELTSRHDCTPPRERAGGCRPRRARACGSSHDRAVSLVDGLLHGPVLVDGTTLWLESTGGGVAVESANPGVSPRRVAGRTYPRDFDDEDTGEFRGLPGSASPPARPTC